LIAFGRVVQKATNKQFNWNKNGGHRSAIIAHHFYPVNVGVKWLT